MIRLRAKKQKNHLIERNEFVNTDLETFVSAYYRSFIFLDVQAINL